MMPAPYQSNPSVLQLQKVFFAVLLLFVTLITQRQPTYAAPVVSSSHHGAGIQQSQLSNIILADSVLTRQLLVLNATRHLTPVDRDRLTYCFLNFRQQLTQETRRINNRLSGYDLQKVLSPSSLTTLTNINTSRHLLAKVRQGLLNHQSKLESLINAFQQDARQLPLSDAHFKTGFVRGVQIKSKDIKHSLNRFFTLQHQMITETEQILSLLQSRYGNYRLVGDQLKFKYPQDHYQMQHHLTRLNNLSEAERHLVQQFSLLSQGHLDFISTPNTFPQQ
ncbi:MAG: hypothetical protein KTR14_06960 [Vampirovibrio sp.]|nr:hypothetical protein [Vampirovibrio sp.]